MFLILLILLLILILGGIGLALVKFLLWIAVIAFVIWLVVGFLARADGARWYRW